MTLSPASVELRLPIPEDAPDLLRGSAAWLRPASLKVSGHWYAQAESPTGHVFPARSWFYATIVGYTSAPGSTTYARGQWGEELVALPHGAYWVPSAPWLVLSSDVMHKIQTALDYLVAAADHA